ALSLEDLPEDDITIEVAYSSVNYKDGLASIPNGKIVKNYPFIPGIDLAGTVVSSNNNQFKKGDKVIATSYDIGVSHFGGFSEYARIKADWIVPLPSNLTLKESMAYGTAGFTAALSVDQIQKYNILPSSGDILVTGATGGVGSTAIAMLSKLGYNVVASTGKKSEYNYLKNLGASEIISREEVNPEKVKHLEKQRWSAAIDTVGGKTLDSILSSIKYEGVIAACRNTSCINYSTTGLPFNLRSINLLLIDSVNCPMSVRKSLWSRMSQELKPESLLSNIGEEVTLEELPEALTNILKGGTRGRTIVSLKTP